MKQKSIVLMLFTMLMGMNVMAQTASYVSTLKEYLSMAGSSVNDKEKMKKVMQTINESHFKQLTVEQSNQLIDEYLNSRYEADLYEKALAPIFLRHASEEDLKQQLALMKSPEGKLANEHEQLASRATGMALGMSILTILSDDNNSDDMTKDVPQSYRALFNKYYEVSKYDQLMASMMNTIVTAMNERINDKTIVDKFARTIKEKLKPISMASYYETMTEDDLNFCIKKISTPSGQHILDAGIEMANNLMSIGMKPAECYIEWLQTKGINAQ